LGRTRRGITVKTKKVLLDKIAADQYGMRTWAKGTDPVILAKAFRAGLKYGRDSSVFEACRLNAELRNIENATLILSDLCDAIRSSAYKTKAVDVK